MYSGQHINVINPPATPMCQHFKMELEPYRIVILLKHDQNKTLGVGSHRVHFILGDHNHFPSLAHRVHNMDGVHGLAFSSNCL